MPTMTQSPIIPNSGWRKKRHQASVKGIRTHQIVRLALTFAEGPCVSKGHEIELTAAEAEKLGHLLQRLAVELKIDTAVTTALRVKK